MHDAHLRRRAIRFRVEENASIDEIAEWLSLPRTTIYYWLRNHPIDRGARPQSDARLRASQANADRAREKREAAYAEGVALWPELSADPSFRDFVVLYIAEGFKRNRNTVAICNSDAAVMKVAHVWMERLATNIVTYSVHHHDDQDLEELRAFWAIQLAISPGRVVFHRKTNSGRLSGRRWRCVNGVMTIRSSDTLLRARLEAWMQQVRGGWIASLPDGV